jgi:uncharacterized membrane protein HdeD (DUF308 family)
MKNWLLWMVIGIISVVGGILALVNPLAASITAARLAGWIFLLVGGAQIFAVVNAQGFGAKIWATLIGVAGVLVGVLLLSNPLAGVISLTVLVAILFLCIGIAKTVMSFSFRGTTYFLPILISGILSVLLAVMIFSNFPMSAVTVLGVLLAIELISNGITLIALSMRQKSDATILLES